MADVALSSGCFIGHEDRIEGADVALVELAGHRTEEVSGVLSALARSRARIVSVHCPFPVRGKGVNLAAEGAAWDATSRAICESMQVASRCGAAYVVVHAFYCLQADLPADDVDRMRALRALHPAPVTMAEYVRSERYQRAKWRAVENLRSIVPALKREFPGTRIVLENLNPRSEYGGIRVEDIAEMCVALDGDVGACLDIGHLTLSAAALGEDPALGLPAVREFVWTTHIHQNFAGRFCVDRRWDEREPRDGLQDVDAHLPLGVRCRRIPRAAGWSVLSDNGAFEGMLEGPVQVARGGPGPLVTGEVRAQRLLALLAPSARRVLEYDSRYAPLDDILAEYHAFQSDARELAL